MEGLVVIEPTVHEDDRGYFMITYDKDIHKALGVKEWVQENESKSKIFTVRGLHYQKGMWSQAKLVRVTKGAVIDSVVDLRHDSETYGKVFSILLSHRNKRQLFVPRGFAHGFSVLSKTAIFNYKCDNVYNPDSEAGINPFDPNLDIGWLIKKEEAILSKKDKMWPNMSDNNKEYIYLQ